MGYMIDGSLHQHITNPVEHINNTYELMVPKQ